MGEPFDSGDEDFPRAERQAPRLQAIDVSSGDVRWDRNILAKPETPAVVDGMVYVRGREPYRRFAAFEPSDEVKEAMREERTDGGVPEYGVVQALSVGDGSEEWRLEHPHPVTTPPAVTEERLVVGTDAGSVLGLDTATGAAIWETPVTDGETVRTAPAIADGVVHVGGGRRYTDSICSRGTNSGRSTWARLSIVHRPFSMERCTCPVPTIRSEQSSEPITPHRRARLLHRPRLADESRH